MSKTIVDRFTKNFRYDPDGCWEWTASRKPKGYGEFRIGSKLQYAHRVSYVLFKGPIAKGLSVCHTCDNPPCVNPDHLFLGTNRENIRDKVNKGRQTKGEESNLSKLTEEAVLLIRDDDRPSREIAKEHDITAAAVNMIKARKRWGWL